MSNPPTWKHAQAPAGVPMVHSQPRGQYGPDCPRCRYGTVSVRAIRDHHGRETGVRAICIDCGHEFSQQTIHEMKWRVG